MEPTDHMGLLDPMNNMEATPGPCRRPAARRTILAGAGIAAGATLLPQVADAEDPYVAAHHHRAPLLSTQARHLVGRFAYGVTPALAREVLHHGGARDWFEWQLSPHHVHDHAGQALDAWFPHLSWSPARISAENNSGRVGGWEVMADYQNWLLLRRIRSRQQVLETMTEFWENHFNVPVGADGVYTWRVRYGHVIRKHALDSFESLLQAVSVHPAMGIYLGNAVSDKDHPNENQGRELLELHTVGLGAGYKERDVVDSARILTGWRVDMWNTWAAFYDKGSHYHKPVRVLGFHSKNHSADGRKVTRGVPALPGAPPGHGHPHRDQAGHGVRLGPAAPLAGEAPRARLPGTRLPDQAGPAGAGGLARVPALGGREDPRSRERPGGDVPADGRPRRPGRTPPTGPPTSCCGRPAPWAWSRCRGRPRTVSRSPAPPGPRPPG